MRLLLVISKQWEVVMRHADRLFRCAPVWCWAVLTVAAVTVLPGTPAALGANAAEEPGVVLDINQIALLEDHVPQRPPAPMGEQVENVPETAQAEAN